MDGKHCPRRCCRCCRLAKHRRRRRLHCLPASCQNGGKWIIRLAFVRSLGFRQFYFHKTIERQNQMSFNAEEAKRAGRNEGDGVAMAAVSQL